jgi:hypothetical protein
MLASIIDLATQKYGISKLAAVPTTPTLILYTKLTA